MASFTELEPGFERLFAIGDIHGCHQELEVLLNFLEGELALSEKDLLIFIGDYIDRGPNSKEVIERLVALQLKFPRTIFLRGNHEDMLLSFLGRGGREGSFYLKNGGSHLTESYGLGPKCEPQQLCEVMPESHQKFFENLQNYVISEKHVFVHAGLNPLRDLKFQLESDLFWIRDEFINNVHYFSKTIVFGHTPYENVLFHLPYKIGIDTGLVYGNTLSCIELTTAQVFQVGQGSKEIQKSEFPKADIIPGKRKAKV